MTAPALLEHGATVTATHPTTGHGVTGRWNANRAHIEVDTGAGAYRVPLEQLAGFTITPQNGSRP